MSHHSKLEPQKVLHQSSVEAIKHQFKQGIEQVKRQLSRTSEEMVQVPDRGGRGASATLQPCLVFDNFMPGAASTSTFDTIDSIERMVSILEGCVRDST